MRTPRATVRIIARPQPRQRLRRRFTSVQLWTAIAGIIGSLTAVPALIISMNALALSEQQRADALKQRAEDQRERAAAQARADQLERTAYIRNINVWAEVSYPHIFHVRNANSAPADIYVRWVLGGLISTEKPKKPDLYFSLSIGPCSQGTLQLPDSATYEREPEWAIDTQTRSELWAVNNGLYYQLDRESWLSAAKGFRVVELKQVVTGIVPCA